MLISNWLKSLRNRFVSMQYRLGMRRRSKRQLSVQSAAHQANRPVVVTPETLEDRTLLAGATLSTGDVAVIGLQSDGTSEFSWVPIVDLPAGTQLYFTDTGYRSSLSRFNDNGATDEWLMRYTTPAGGVAAGTVQKVIAGSEGVNYTFFTGTNLGEGTTVNLSVFGDQIHAFQSTDDPIAGTSFTATSFNPLFAASSATTDWAASTDTVSVNESNLGLGLTDAVNAVAAGSGAGASQEFDNVRYIGPTSGTRSVLLASIANSANWAGSNSAQTGGSNNAVTAFTVVPEPQTSITLNAGVLTITDILGGTSADQIQVSYSGGTYTITDIGGLILDASTIPGSTGSGTATVAVPDTGVTGILIDALGGDDTLTIDLSGGQITQNIVFNGGGNGATGDKLVVTGGTFGTVTYDATDATDGVLDFGTSTITFTGLEPVDLTGSSITDLVVNVDPGHAVSTATTTTIAQSGGTDTLVSFTGGLESVLFRSLTGTLTINGENRENDTITVNGVGTSFAGGADD